MNDDVSTLADWIADSPSTVFFGGAGVSTESGIPDFRGANGALHNWGCSWGLNPPVSRSARVM